MPADRTERVVRHAQSHRETRRFSAPQNDHLTESSGSHVLASSSEPEYAKKKKTLQVRHNALMHRLSTPSTPYSKSHMRRLKRKAKGALCTDLTSMREALATVETQDGPRNQLGHSAGPHADIPSTLPPKRHHRQIGEGKHASLTKKQRKRTFQVEKLRHKLIMVDKNFAKNPFQALQTHARNTLVKHDRTAHQPS